MPYELRGNCVHKVGHDKPMKCYDNHKAALAYLRALEANVADAKATMDDCMKQHVADLKKQHPDMSAADMTARAKDECSKAMDKALDEKADDAPSSPDAYAYVPDPKSPSTWKLRIDDRVHVGQAIAALGPNPPHGKGPDIPADAKAGVIRRIRAAISKVANDDKDKQAMLDDLAKVKALDTTAKMMMFMQDEVNYGAANGQVGKACSVCRWYCPPGDMEEAHCHLVMAMPAPITPNGLCDRWEAIPTTNTEPAPIPVTIVEPDDSMEMALPQTRRGFIDLITDTMKSILRPEPAPEPAFQVLKANGKAYWLARHTGKFVDREDEIIVNRAHDEYVQRVQKGLVPMPILCTWHKLASKHGQALMVWKSGGFTLAFGTFDDTPEGEHAYRFYEKNAGTIKLSHMFNYPKSAKQGKHYHAYNTIEITTLPDGAEAFPYTSFEEIKPMALTKEQREFIKGVGGDDMLKRVEAADAKADGDTKTLDALGIESKGLDNFEGATIPAPQSEVEALKSVQTDIETRLKAIEALPAQLTALHATIKALTDQVAASQAAESAALDKVNTLEKQLLEYQALKPRASESDDTLLNARDKSLLDQVIIQAKVVNAPSLVEQMVVGQPTIATGDGQ